MNTKPNISFENTEVAFSSRRDAELKKMYLIFTAMNQRWAVNLGVALARLAFKLKLPVKGLMKKTVFGHFCGGESIKDSARSIKELADYGIGTILDYSVEGEGTEKSYDFTRDEIRRTILRSAGAKEIPFTVFKATGLGDYKVMTKVQAGKELSSKEREAFVRLKSRFNSLCKAAYENNVRILVDGEESWFQDVIDDMTYDAMSKYNQEKAIVYNTFQMYRRDMLKNLKAAHHDAVAKGYFLGVKIVRGAYMEKEADRAEEMGYPNPIHPTKKDTDECFNKGLQFCVNNKQRVFLVNGSHNDRSNIMLTELMGLHGVKPDDERFYFAQLYGMGDHLSYNLALAGYNVAKYVPYGPVEAVMPYLSRRAKENSSMSGHSSKEIELIKKEMARRAAIKKEK